MGCAGLHNGGPGSLISALSGSTDPTAAGQYTYSASGVTLPGSTDFFLVASRLAAPGRLAYEWEVTGDPAETSAFDWTIANNRWISTDSGSSWSLDAVSGQAGPLYLEISGTAAGNTTPVPEPASIAFWSLLGLGLFAFRRFRRKN